MKIFIIIIAIVVSGIWGHFQPYLFPSEKYGYLWLLTSFIGGCLIGYLVSNFILNKY